MTETSQVEICEVSYHVYNPHISNWLRHSILKHRERFGYPIVKHFGQKGLTLKQLRWYIYLV